MPTTRGWRRGVGAVPIMLVVVVVAVLPFVVPNQFRLYTAVLATVYLIAAIGLNIVLGYAGLLSIGTHAFALIGAYTVAIAQIRWGAGFAVGIVVGVLLCALVGVVTGFPALRLGVFAVAVVTLAYGTVATSLILYFSDFTGGGDGLPAARSGLSLTMMWYLVAALAAAAAMLQRNLVRAPMGRAWRLGRLSPVLAGSLGVSVNGTRLVAFTIGAGLGGLSGALYPMLNGYTNTEPFSVELSLLLLVIVVLGGEGTLWGPVLGTIVYTAIPLVLNEAFGEGGHVVELGYGLLLLGVVLVARRGLVGLIRLVARRRGEASGSVSVSGAPAASPVPPSRPVPDAPELPLLRPRHAPGPLTVSRLSKHIGGVQAVSGVSLIVRPATIHGLIGPNGAGKTTLLNCVSGFLEADAGDLRLGEIVLEGPPHRRARAGVARTFQEPQLLEDDTLLDNLLVGIDAHRHASHLGYLFRSRQARREAAEGVRHAAGWLEAVGLRNDRDRPAGDLPPGRRRQLEIVRALATGPQILLMDEPAAGLNEPEIDELEALILGIRARGVGVLLIEHHAEFVMRVCDEITVLDSGKVIAQGTPSEVRRDPAVIRAYLGGALGSLDQPSGPPELGG